MVKHIMMMISLVVGAVGMAATTVNADGHGAHSTVGQSGTFEGRSDHIVTGGVSILKTASGYVVVLESNFSLDGAPAPVLGFGNDGKFDENTNFTKLENKEGLQVYAIPSSISPADFGEIYVWCSRFDIPLGVATLSK